MPSKTSKPVGVLTAIAGLLSFSALAGVLVTALVAPALAVTSMTANSTIGIFESLPDYMEIGQLSQKNVMYGKSGSQYVQFAEVYKQNREEVSWEEVSPLIKDALVAGEDRRFYEHGGVDVQSLIRAALGNIASSEIESGASTLAMQLVKNINIQEAVLLPDEDEREKALGIAQEQSLDRKLKEAKLAIGLEKNYTKNQILLAYLNITGFGGNTYGIQSAAKQYYGKTAQDVTLAEAASLIAIVQLPNDRNLDDPEKYPANKERRDYILDSMLELDMITKAEHHEAVTTPLEDYVDYHSPTSGCTYATNAKTFCDYILKSVPELEMLGSNATERQANWDRGGYSIYTTIDLKQQTHAQKQLNYQTPASESRFHLGSVAASTQVGTGRILVMAQNKGFDDTGEGNKRTTTAVNFATDRDKGGSAGFPPGSTYKIFTLTDWLTNGRGLGEIVNATPRDFKTFPSSCDGGTLVIGGKYHPANDAGEKGPWTVLRSTSRSVNVAYMSMAQQLDLCEIRDVATSMGAHRADGAPLGHNPSTVLGTEELAPMTMALAMATIASGGTYCAPIAIDKIVDSDGTDLGGQKRDCHQAITPDVAAAAAYALEAVMAGGGTAGGGGANPYNGHPLIGKTGTTDDAWHTWTLGSSTKVALVVWVGNIIGKQSLRQISLAHGFGASARHRIFNPIIDSLTRSYGGGGFPSPPAKLISGSTITIPAVGGQSIESVKALLESLGFTVTVGDPVASSQTTGAVATTNPAPGTAVSKGYSIIIRPSDGSLYVVMPDVVGSDPASARSTLVGAGFSSSKINVNWVEDPGNVCTVLGSSPSAGAGTSKKAAVTLNVGTDDPGNAPTTPCPL